MAISKEFSDAVQADNMIRVRIMLKDSLLMDPSAALFDEMLSYAERSMGRIRDSHDGAIIDNNADAWTVDYLNDQMVDLVDNFSDERIALLKKMVCTLYADKIRKSAITASEEDYHRTITQRQIGTGVAVAGAAFAVAGVCTSHVVLTVDGVVAAAAGVALILTDKEK